MMDEKRPDKEQKERGRKYLVTKIALLIVGAAALFLDEYLREQEKEIGKTKETEEDELWQQM